MNNNYIMRQNQPCSKRVYNELGVTLIELIVAISVIIVLVGGIVAGSSVLTNNAKKSSVESAASSIAQKIAVDFHSSDSFNPQNAVDEWTSSASTRNKVKITLSEEIDKETKIKQIVVTAKYGTEDFIAIRRVAISNSPIEETNPVIPVSAPDNDITKMTYNCDVDTQVNLATLISEEKPKDYESTIVKNKTTNEEKVYESFQNIVLEAKVDYEISTKGKVSIIRQTDADVRKCLVSIEAIGEQVGVSMIRALGGEKLVDVPPYIPSSVNTLDGIFAGATMFNDPDITRWDVSNVKYFNGMFEGAKSFNQPLNNWDMSNTISVSSMFRGASSFNQPLNNWNTSNITTISNIFNGASSFNQPLNNWDISKVENLSSVFKSAESFNQPLNEWNTSNSTSMSFMFNGAKSFNQDISNWNTSRLLKADFMFSGAYSFNQSLNNWNVSKVNNMDNMFSSTKDFDQPLNKWDTSNVTNMRQMFANAYSFKQDISNWNVEKVEKWENFYKATIETENFIPKKFL